VPLTSTALLILVAFCSVTTYFTSDLHFSHARISEYSGRPYQDVAGMNDDLIERWNATIGPGDTVYVLGDVALGPIQESLQLVGRLAGRKLLVPGNHDRCWSGDKRNAKRHEYWIEAYLAAGFEEILEDVVEVQIGKWSCLACHFPYSGDHTEQERFSEFRPVDDGRWLLHGHVHEKWRVRERMVNVGVDAWGGLPVSEAHLSELIGVLEPRVRRGEPVFLPPLPWRQERDPIGLCPLESSLAPELVQQHQIE